MTNAGDKETLEKSEKWMDGMGAALGCQRTFSTWQFSVIFLQKQFANAQKKSQSQGTCTKMCVFLGGGKSPPDFEFLATFPDCWVSPMLRVCLRISLSCPLCV